MSVTLNTTHGALKIELFCSAVQTTAYNFLALCASGRYDHSPFHRLIPGFMIQGGSPAPPSDSSQTFDYPTGTKASPSIYNDNGTFADEVRPALRHNARGVLSMANKGPDMNGSQFFVLFAAAPHLDAKNTVFGKVIEGQEEGGTLDAMERVATDGKKARPVEKCEIESVVIHANPLADEG
ncbi:MAG: Peptidyl-prolyl cis-trans isomerase cyp10 [Chrysothrix sp. TS-e1954]|nr:MAG: Peptidyl-prolyl cis-trans isomerase cyp10 [Chrysothrix sp. TS-e1954]